jgi:hypothetical protein
MKVFEVTVEAKVSLDESFLDNLKAFASEVTDMVGGDDNTTTSQVDVKTDNTPTDTTQSDIAAAVDAAKKKIAPTSADNTTTNQQPEGNAWVRKNNDDSETADSFKRWLRADGPGREKFAGKTPGDYTAGMTRLLGQGYALRALEVYKLWGSKSNITPQALQQIKSAAADQAKELGL